MVAVVDPAFAQYWGIIQSASGLRASTADLWALINAYEEQEGISRPAGLFQAVSTMRSLAVSGRNAGDALTNAADSAVIDASMIAQGINSRPLNEQSAAPAYTIRYQATVLTSEGESTVWRSIVQRGTMLTTKGDLVDSVLNDFINSAAAYAAIPVDLTGAMTITAI